MHEMQLSHANERGSADNHSNMFSHFFIIITGVQTEPVVPALFSAAVYAVLHKDASCLRALLDYGVDVNVYMPDGKPLISAALCGVAPDCVRLLLESQADANQRDYHHLTPLSLAIHAGSMGDWAKGDGMFECIGLLLEHRADPISESYHPGGIANCGCRGSIRGGIATPCYPCPYSKDGRFDNRGVITPIQLAVEYNPELVDLLSSFGARFPEQISKQRMSQIIDQDGYEGLRRVPDCNTMAKAVWDELRVERAAAEQDRLRSLLSQRGVSSSSSPSGP